jgi:hypothetical protein
MTLSSSMAYLSFNGCVIGSHRHGYAASLSQHRHQLSRIAPNPLAEERAARAWCRKEKLRREPLAGITQQDRLWT